MRNFTQYEDYLIEKRKMYKYPSKGHKYYYQALHKCTSLYRLADKYDRIAYDTTFSKKLSDELLQVEYIEDARYPFEVNICIKNIIQIQKEMVYCIKADAARNLKNEYTLTRHGCRIVEEYANKIRDILRNMKPPVEEEKVKNGPFAKADSPDDLVELLK